MKISVNVPTYNDSARIEEFVKNVKDIADEILLIDNSTDDTVKIAKKASNKTRIIHYEPKDFAKIRNKGLEETKNGWYVLYMDADELLSNGLIKEITELKKEKTTADAYLIKRSHYFKYPNGTAHLTTRMVNGEPKLARKGVIKFVGSMHEKAEYIVKDPVIKSLKNSTKHYPVLGKYIEGSKYLNMHVKETIKNKTYTKELLKLIKQLIKYIINFDYKPRYWKGNTILWFGTVKHIKNFIKEYKKELK